MADELETEDIETDESAEEEPLIFGKYKNMDEAEKGYKELEREFHAVRQPVKEEPADFGYVNVPGTAPAPETDPNEAFYENPTQFVAQAIANVRQYERIAGANRKAALRELKTHPAYGALVDRLEERLDREVDPSYLFDPNTAKEVVTAMFGQELVRHTAQATPEPVVRMRTRAVPDIEKPGDVDDTETGDALDADGIELLRSLGLPAKARKAASDSFTRRLREERTRR